jgi:hypothetical protein
MPVSRSSADSSKVITASQSELNWDLRNTSRKSYGWRMYLSAAAFETEQSPDHCRARVM